MTLSVAQKAVAHIVAEGGRVVRDEKLTPPVSPAVKIIATARKYLGVHEVDGDNAGPHISGWLIEQGGQPGWAWCLAYALSIVKEAGYGLNVKTCGCSVAREWAQRNGRWSQTPRPGYIGIVKGDEHAVIVTSWSGSTVYDIAGNTSESDGSNYAGGYVAAHAHPLSLFSGFIRTY